MELLFRIATEDVEISFWEEFQDAEQTCLGRNQEKYRFFSLSSFQEPISMAWLEHSHVLDNSASSGKALFFEPEVEGLKVQLRGIGCLIHRHAQWFCLKGN